MGESKVLKKVFSTIVNVLGILARDEEYIYWGDDEEVRFKIRGKWVVLYYDGEVINIRVIKDEG